MRLGELWRLRSFRSGVALAVVAAVLVILSPVAAWRAYRTEATGTLGEGRVVEHSTRAGTRTTPNYEMLVEFVASDGTTHRVWLDAGQVDLTLAPVGSRVGVFYDPREPDRARLTRTGNRGAWWLPPLLYLLGGVLAGIAAFFLIRRAARIPPEARAWADPRLGRRGLF